ncbi:hypothetical protein OS493_014311 [Desmophyllum pertusum]|uniref:Uncharacterized protein n=1 Tax=Desmophyllum pertusum TaxID=174260 RepID=A0A9W9Z3S0_9CNID|nr:hypothetical protein OS493_014311 [Desmophyllum pertusum]
MDDLFYPNNHKREVRMNQLANDIQNLVYELAKDADNIKSLFEEVDKTIKKMYSDIESLLGDCKDVLPPGSLWKVALGEAALGELIEGLGMLDIVVGVGAIVIVVGVELGIDAIAGAKKDRSCDMLSTAPLNLASN